MVVMVVWMASCLQSDMKHTVRISLSKDTYDRLIALYFAFDTDRISFSDFLSCVLDSLEIKNGPSVLVEV